MNKIRLIAEKNRRAKEMHGLYHKQGLTLAEIAARYPKQNGEPISIQRVSWLIRQVKK
jgi:hypothetical protein